MSVTIHDVARKAGVSASTVSRVISGSPLISPETQARVRQAMEELDYIPNAIARSLARQSSLTLAFSISRSAEQAFANPFFPEVIRGCAGVAQERGYNLLLTTAPDQKTERQNCLTLVRERRVDGIILSASHVHDRVVEDLVSRGVPVVVIGRPNSSWEQLYWVNNDNVESARQATRHLIALGHRQIAFISGPPDLMVSRDRATGFREAMKEAGLKTSPKQMAAGAFTEEGGAQALEALWQKGAKFTAVVCADDMMALGVMRSLEEKGLQVPGDVAVVGFNDSPLAAYVRPALTTIRIPIYELGRAATSMLIDVINGRPPASNYQLLPTELIVRESCGAKAQAAGR